MIRNRSPGSSKWGFFPLPGRLEEERVSAYGLVMEDGGNRSRKLQVVTSGLCTSPMWLLLMTKIGSEFHWRVTSPPDSYSLVHAAYVSQAVVVLHPRMLPFASS